MAKARDGYQPGPQQSVPAQDITEMDEAIQETLHPERAAEVTPSVNERLAFLEEENARLKRLHHGTGGRFLVAEVWCHPTRKSKLDSYAVDIVADVPAARDVARKLLHDPKKSPYGGRLRTVLDPKEQAYLVSVLPRNWPDFQLEKAARAASMQDNAALEEAIAKNRR